MASDPTKGVALWSEGLDDGYSGAEIHIAINALAEAAYAWAESDTEADSPLAKEERDRERELRAVIARHLRRARKRAADLGRRHADLLCAVDELLSMDAECDPEFWLPCIERGLQHLRTARGRIPDPKEPYGPDPTPPDPAVLRLRAPAAATAGGQQAAGRSGARDGGETAAERGDERRPEEAPRGEGLLREGEADALSAAVAKLGEAQP